MGKLSTFVRTANLLGPGLAGRARVLWRLSKNVRVRAGLASYHPERVEPLATVYGNAYLRDNFGDVTNLSGLWVDNVYGVTEVEGDGCILDVGANIGLFAAWVHRHNPERALFCFEPLPANAELVRRNCPEATVLEYGLGRETSKIAVNVDDHGMMASHVEQPWETRESFIEVKPLDEVAEDLGIGEVALLKMDTEGAEIDVLEGGRQTLARVARVVMETHSTELHQESIDRLEGAGIGVDREFFDGHTGFVYARRP